MAVKIKPQAGYIIAQPQAAKAKTASGFYLPEAAQEKSKVVLVIDVGDEKPLRCCRCKSRPR
jgi:co-chaperonin GroES (HSP10)